MVDWAKNASKNFVNFICPCSTVSRCKDHHLQHGESAQDSVVVHFSQRPARLCVDQDFPFTTEYRQPFSILGLRGYLSAALDHTAGSFLSLCNLYLPFLRLAASSSVFSQRGQASDWIWARATKEWSRSHGKRVASNAELLHLRSRS